MSYSLFQGISSPQLQLSSLAGARASAPTQNTSALLSSLIRQKQLEEERAFISQQVLAAQMQSTFTASGILEVLQQKREIEALRREIVASASASQQMLQLLAEPRSTHPSLGQLPSTTTTGLEALANTALAYGSDPVTVSTTASLPIHQERKSKRRSGSFPQKLHHILEELESTPGGISIAAFLPHGRGFIIYKPREFVEKIMSKYFRMSRFSSFQRQLNLYDFQRVTEGRDKGAYYHELFVKGRPDLSSRMKRNKIKGIKLNKEGKEDHQSVTTPTEEESCDGGLLAE